MTESMNLSNVSDEWCHYYDRLEPTPKKRPVLRTS